jgi:transcriptional regulator with PAS, ATPase and Fis domain
MLAVIDSITRFAHLDTAVLIEGETGTGKELVAGALHALGGRAPGPMVTVDCGALPESLTEAELFGYERGAFTGAEQSYCGRIEGARGGTLFLDEVNSLSLGLQAKLLRFLETRQFTRLGRQRPTTVDARVIAASNVPLEGLVRSGLMRADFYYRLDGLRIEVPPLRERLDDISLLARQFLEEDAAARTIGVHDVDQDVIAQLQTRPWPGNVRELRNLLRRSVVSGAEGGVLCRLDGRVGRTSGHGVPDRSLRTFHEWMREREGEYLRELLRTCATFAERMAVSGLPERTLYRKMKLARSAK